MVGKIYIEDMCFMSLEELCVILNKVNYDIRLNIIYTLLERHGIYRSNLYYALKNNYKKEFAEIIESERRPIIMKSLRIKDKKTYLNMRLIKKLKPIHV